MSTVREELMAPETGSTVIDYTPVVHELLTEVVEGRRRPRKLHGLFSDAASALVYPPLVLVAVNGDEAGLELVFVGPLWHLGSGGVGPMILDREYVSGADKLDNGTFDLDDLYWRRASEGGMWVLSGGNATNAGGLSKDDVLENERKFPTRPGYAFRMRAEGVTGVGRLRERIIFDGRFNPPNLLTNWLTVDALTIGPITKPQLLNFGAGPTTLGPSMTFSGGTLTAGPNPRPTYITDPGFETGGGWTDQIGPPTRPMSDDIDIVNDPANAASGSYVMTVGPITQHQLLQNATFNADLSNWYMSSNVADPDPGIFYWFATDGVDGTGGATTAGFWTPVPLAVTDSSEYDSWMASHGGPYDAVFQPNGTPYTTFEANSLADANRGAPGYMQDFNGTWITTATAATPVALAVSSRREFWTWLASMPNGTSYATWEANSLADPNRHAAGYGQDADGSWAPRGREVKYLRADASSGTGGVQAYDVKPSEQYEVEAMVRRSPAADGFAYISAHIPHPTVANREQWFTSKEVKSEGLPGETFERLSFPVNIPANRFKMDLLFEVHEHNAEYWTVDNFLVTRTRGNRAQINSDQTTTVVPGTRYQGTALMRSGDEMQVGSVRVGVILTGAGVDPRVVDDDHGSTDYEWTSVAVDFTPDAGYTDARRFVAGLDLVGEPAYIDNFQITRMNNNSDTSTWASVPVVADQRYLFQVDAEVLGATEGSLTVGIKLTGPAVAPEYMPVTFNAKDNAGINSLSTEVRPPPGYDAATLYAQSTDISGGTGIKVHRATLTKMDNNTAETVGSTINVTPERTYKWTQETRSGVNLQRGTVTLSARCKRTGYDDIVFPSSPMEATAGGRKVLEFSVTPPSGYNQIVVSVVGTDVEGDSWTVGAGELRDTDTATAVFDTTMDNPAAATADVFATAPDGAEFVRVAVIAEQGTSAWTVGSVALARTGHVPATGNTIVGDMLEDPDTGALLSIAPGTLSCPEAIPYDWVIQNMTNRDALDHYCNVVSEPTREYRVLPTSPPTIDVGTQAAVFTVHDPADALLPEDIDVEELSNPETNVEERATVIEVIGAEVQTVSGRPFLITATAQVPGPVEYDFNNRPIVRTKQAHDGTVDHRGYAQALADDLALRESEPALALNVKLSGIDTRPDSPPGDTIYVYEPEAGLEDPTNPVTIEGQTVFPRAVRVLARERSLGPSYSIQMRKSDGSLVQFRQKDGTFGPDLPGVRWADEDATMLTVGDRLPEWIRDPQGKGGGDDFLRWRAQKPR